MILAAVKQLLMKRKALNLLELATTFNVSPDVMRQMLSHWMAKGKVDKNENNQVCPTACHRCHPLTTEIYVWRE